MKSKTLIKYLSLLCFCLLPFNSFSQNNKQKVAIYVAKNTSNDAKNNTKMQQYSKFFANELQLAVSRSSAFNAVERTGKFLALLNKEQAYQRTGEVDENKIAELGKQEGVDYVLSVELIDMGDNTIYTVWKMINVETAIVQDGDSELKTITNMVEDLKFISSNITKRITSNSAQKDTAIPVKNGKRFWTEDELKRAGFRMQSDYFQGIIDYELTSVDGVNGLALCEAVEGTTYKYGEVVNGRLQGLVLLHYPSIPNEMAGRYEIAYCVNGKVATPTIYVYSAPLLTAIVNGQRVMTTELEEYEANKNTLLINQYGIEDAIEITELKEDENPMLEYLYKIFGKDITKQSFLRAFQNGNVDMEVIQRNFDKFILNEEKIPSHVWTVK